MDKTLSGLSKAILAVMVIVVLAAAGVVVVLRGMEKAISPLRKSEYVARDRVETSSLIAHGYWIFDAFDYADYAVSDVLPPLQHPIYPEPDAGPEDYQAARYYSCNFNPEEGKGYYYWISFKEIEDIAQFNAYLASLSKMYPFSLISDRYNRYYHDQEYDKGNRKTFFKLFGLPDPQNYEPVMVAVESHRFFGDEIPGAGSDMDGLLVKSVDNNRLVLTYKDANGALDLIYKNKSSLPRKPLSYSVYFNGQN